MKKTLCFALICLALLASAAAQASLSKYPLSDLGASISLPSDYTVVTPETVSSHLEFFGATSAEDAEREMILSGVHVAAFSPSQDVMLRLTAVDGDETAKAYHDIERYTAAMRTEIRTFFLDRKNFDEGMRYTEADWTNKTGRGRILQLQYTVREGEEIIIRGRQAYTIRAGMAFTLDMQVTGRRISAEDERMFDSVLGALVFPRDENVPLLPVGLKLAEPIPEEVHRDTLTLRGETTKGATVAAYYQPNIGNPVPIGEVTASNSGAFRLDIQLYTGDNRIYILATLGGFEDSDVAAWVNYDPSRLPVSFTSYPEGIVTDERIIVSGKTIPGVTIQCMEGETNKKTTTGSDGRFSFTLDRDATGSRRVALSFDRAGFANRRFTFDFTREWLMEDWVRQLAKQAQSLSYQNLTENTQRFIGRIVCYSGLVVEVSESEGVTYVDLASRQDSSGNWGNRIIAFSEAGMEIPLQQGDMADIYFEVTPETFTFPDNLSELDGQTIELPAVKLLGYAVR